MGVARQGQERRMAVFSDAYTMWTESRSAQAQAAELLGVCERTFRRWVARRRDGAAEDGDIEALRDRRLERASHRAAPADEVARMVDGHRTRYCGWNVRHCHTRYRRGAVRSGRSARTRTA